MTSHDMKSQDWRFDKCCDLEFTVNDKLTKNIQTQNGKSKPFYQLSFKYTFDADTEGSVYFAYSTPYSYSQLLRHLD